LEERKFSFGDNIERRRERSHLCSWFSFLLKEPVPNSIDRCVILYVEDDDATAYLFEIALREIGIAPQVFRVAEGDEALAFLNKQDVFADAPTPDLILLDLNLPIRSGFEVLSHIRECEAWRSIPVYVFSTSTYPADRAEAMSRGATGYLVKGDSFAAFLEVAKTVCSYLS
jgi:two-component system response regulator